MYIHKPYHHAFKYNLVLLFFLLSTVLFSQNKFVVKHYTQKNGLPQNSVNQVYFDKNNFLWLATEAGLVRFDGVNFKVFNTQNSIVENERFRWIYPTFDKQVIASDAGGNLLKIENNLLQKVQRANLLTNLINLNCGLPTLGNFLKFKQLLTDATPNINFYPFKFIPHNDSISFILGKKYVYKYHNALLVDSILTATPKYSNYFFKVGAHYYLANNEGTFFYINLKNKSLEQCSVDGITNSKNTFITIIYKTQAYKTYLVQKNIINILELVGNNPNHLKLNFISNQIPENFKIVDIEYNKALDVYAIGSTTNGLYIFKPNLFKVQYEVNPTKSGANAIYAIDEINDSTVFSSIQTSFSSNQVLPYTVNNNVINFETVFNDNKNRLWFAKNDSLFYFDKAIKAKVYVKKYAQVITCINVSGDSIWVGQPNHLSLIIYKNQKIVYQKEIHKITSRIVSICVSPNNEVYFSNAEGVFRVMISDEDTYIVQLIHGANFRDVYYYKNIVFATSYGSGWYAFYKNKAYKLPLDRNHYLAKCHSIKIDSNKNVWISSNNGLFETSLKQVLNYMADTSKSITFNYYNEENGIDNSEFNGGCYPASVQLKNGTMAFPSMSGLVSFNPYLFKKRASSSQIFIDKIEVNNLPINVLKSIEIEPNTELLNIYFTSPYWYNDYDVNYQYQLIGYNSKPVSINGENKISFTNLNAGKYVLIIKKITGKDNTEGVLTLNIKVHKKYYQTWWFIALIISAIAILILLAVKYYNSILVRRNAILEYKVSARTFELAKANSNLKEINEQLLFSEQQNLRSLNLKSKLIAILSHDIITPLKFISMVARNSKKMNEGDDFKSILNDIDHTSRRLYENAQNILNWIKYQSTLINVQKTNVPLFVLVDEIGELLKEVMDSKNNVLVNSIDPDQIIYTDKNILSIVVHNLISNATKYNSNVTIEVTAEIKNDFHCITISDNGKGMSNQNLERIVGIKNRQKAYSVSENSESSGLGFIIITELLAILNGTFDIKSNINGTQITLEIPIDTYAIAYK